MQRYAVIDVNMSKLCSLVMFGVIKCPLCGSVGPGVNDDRALTQAEADVNRAVTRDQLVVDPQTYVPLESP